MEVRRQVQPGRDFDIVEQFDALGIVQEIERAGQIIAQLGIEIAQAERVFISALDDALPPETEAAELSDGTGLFVGNAEPAEDPHALI